MLRSAEHLPKQAGTLPWRLHQNYIRDIRMLRHGPIDDEIDFPLPAGSADRHRAGDGGLAVSDPASGAGVSPEIEQANRAVSMQLPFEDRDDFEDALRGRLGSLSDGVIARTDGRVVWDLDAYDFLDGECPPSVNPSLWRQGQLNAIHGLFEVAEGIYQVRGLDLSNMTIVEGEQRRARDRPADQLRVARRRRSRCTASTAASDR